MTSNRLGVTVFFFLLNAFLLGTALSLPDVELPPEDVPSLYWATQRFGRVSIETPDGEIVELSAISEWKALTELRQMRVWVSDAWLQLPYDGRYRLVHGLGDIAARKGYSLMVVDLNNTVLATYDCRESRELEESESPDSSAAEAVTPETEISETATPQTQCRIDFNPPAATDESLPPRL
ncbi:MAG: hypothetical protein AAF974_08795 [Cyanobacteria bacterium P01_E01_bin.34]